MSRTIVISAVALAIPFVAVAAEPGLKGIEAEVQKVVDATSPTVVSVVVSHAKEHKPPAKAKPGELGPVDPLLFRQDEFRPRFPRQTAPPPHPLDLSHPDNVGDNLFGSGVVLDEKQGLILTPYHLIDGARKVFVRGPKGKGSYADIHAADAKSDLAVLRLLDPSLGLKAVKIADVRLTDGPDGEKPNLKKGSVVIALGHPTASAVGEGSASASWGVLSNFRQKSATAPPGLGPAPGPLVQKPLHLHGGLIQVDARVALGSTGAALFNADGELVGLGSSVAAVYGSDANGGLAVPMDQNYRRVVAALKEGKEVEYGFLGISPRDLDGGGVYIDRVTAGCPAILAGLTEGDVLTAIDGHPLKSSDDLLLYGGAALAGYEVTVEYTRNGVPKQKAKLTMAKNLNSLPFIASNPPPTPFGIKVDYYSVKFAGGGLIDRNPKNPPPGVLVREVEPGSAGEKRLKGVAQPKAGAWLITHVDGKPVSTPKEYFALTDGKRSVKLHLADPDDPNTRDVISLP